MRKESRNWIKINKKLLRFGDLSRRQRDNEGLNIRYNEAWIKCEQCDEDLLAKRSGKDWVLKDEKTNREWDAFRRKAVVEKSKEGYFIISRIEFYCPNCLAEVK